MLSLLLAVVPAALATPGSAGAAHIGASALDGGQVWVGTGGVVAWAGGVFAAPGLEAGTALGPEGRGAFQISGGIDGRADAAPVLASVRHNLVDGERFRFAATGQVWVVPVLPGANLGVWGDVDDKDVLTWWSPGLALEAGSERVWFDMSAPVWGFSSYNQYVGPARSVFPLGGTLGVDFQVAEHHRLRFGLPELLSWSVRTDHVYFDVGGFTIGIGGFVWMKLGAVF